MICGVCGRTTGERELVLVESRLVCDGCKSVAIQEIREGIPVPVITAPIDLGDRLPSFGRFLKLGAMLWQRDWPVIVLITVIAYLPANLCWILELLWNRPFVGDYILTAEVFNPLESFLQIGGGIFAAMGIAFVVQARVLGRPASFSSAMRHASDRWLAGVATTALGAVITIFMLLLLVVPGLIFMGYYSLANPVVSLRDVSGDRALGYSKSLVRDRWWAVVGLLLSVAVMEYGVVWSLQYGLSFLPPSRMVSVFGSISVEICYSFSTVTTALLFLNADGHRRGLPVY